jgi:hypothetical protein
MDMCKLDRDSFGNIKVFFNFIIYVAIRYSSDHIRENIGCEKGC